jgi:hypothetical protein
VTMRTLFAVLYIAPGVTSRHTQRSYRSGLEQFFAWLHTKPGQPFSKALVGAYRAQLLKLDLSPSTLTSGFRSAQARARAGRERPARSRRRDGYRARKGGEAGGCEGRELAALVLGIAWLGIGGEKLRRGFEG